MHNYESIINLPHHVSKKRKPMSLKKRSAQFAPFSALKGYREKINEINRLNIKKTNEKPNQKRGGAEPSLLNYSKRGYCFCRRAMLTHNLFL